MSGSASDVLRNSVLPINQAARAAGVSPQSLRRAIKDGIGPKLLRITPRRIGIRARDLDVWLESRADDRSAA